LVIVVVVAVAVVAEVVVEIISTLVAVGGGGDYLDTSSGSSSKDYFGRSPAKESVLWTTNCPLVLACSGLGDSGHFPWSLYTFRIQSVFLLFIKYTHDYPQVSPWRHFSYFSRLRYCYHKKYLDSSAATTDLPQRLKSTRWSQIIPIK
jgi:hypothetical protein